MSIYIHKEHITLREINIFTLFMKIPNTAVNIELKLEALLLCSFKSLLKNRGCRLEA